METVSTKRLNNRKKKKKNTKHEQTLKRPPLREGPNFLARFSVLHCKFLPKSKLYTQNSYNSQYREDCWFIYMLFYQLWLFFPIIIEQ